MQWVIDDHAIGERRIRPLFWDPRIHNTEVSFFG
jgi:hypothetical protein